MSYDLLLQADGPTSPEKARALSAAASSLPGEPGSTWEPPFGRDPEDSRELVQEMLDEGELRAEDFQKFCREHSLAEGIDPIDGNSAAEFLLRFWGCPVVSFSIAAHSDEEEVRAIDRAAVEFARAHALELHDPQLGDEIDLDDPGDLPPAY